MTSLNFPIDEQLLGISYVREDNSEVAVTFENKIIKLKAKDSTNYLEIEVVEAKVDLENASKLQPALLPPYFRNVRLSQVLKETTRNKIVLDFNNIDITFSNKKGEIEIVEGRLRS